MCLVLPLPSQPSSSHGNKFIILFIIKYYCESIRWTLKFVTGVKIFHNVYSRRTFFILFLYFLVKLSSNILKKRISNI